MFGQTLLAALKQGRHGFTAMSEIARDTSDLWTNRLMRRAEYLHVLGHLGPLMGLLGTVLGMIRAFGKMQETHGGYRPEDLAGGISLALVNTFLGLALAVLALGMFGVCRNRIEALTSEAAATVQGLLEHFRPASGEMTIAPRTPRIDTTTPVPPPPPAATPRPYSLRGATGLR
ncbi:MAG: MotA/TolQ/ExbB proton channel family protein [Phycisphaerae bacterium]